MRLPLALCLLFAVPAPAVAAATDIPSLNWEQRSDWINVKTDLKPAAVGDGKADDTAAIQAALDFDDPRTCTKGEDPKRAVYLPPGTYRITKPLVFQGSHYPLRALGCLVIGHGRDTRLVWDGPAGGRMFWSNGMPYSRYIGLSWDGRNKAAVGIYHGGAKGYETEITHEHEAFRNFTESAIQIAHLPIAASELLYHNCLFENCEVGLKLIGWNDYDNTLDRCEFRNCGRGVWDMKGGNYYVRNSHFERSRIADVQGHSEHGSSIRRCTSVGSKQFILMSGCAPLTVQDCHVAGWTDPDAAVVIGGSPVLMFDCSFSRPPSDRPPVRIAFDQQKLMLSNNRPEPVDKLVQKAPPTAKVYVIPPGKRGGVVRSAEQRFFSDTATMPGKIFDAVRDFGAKGDGQADDTAAIQAAIDAARQAGRRAMAYLPTGRYVVKRTLQVTGSDYSLCGAGFRCGLLWRGAKGLPIVEVRSPQNIRLENLAVGCYETPMNHGDDVRVTSDGPCRLVLNEFSGFGMYQKAPDLHGIHFVNLPKGSVIVAPHVQGNLRITDCARATFLFRTAYEGTVTIEGAATPRDGFIGFLTRLATITRPTLRVRDNQSVVMSDFYGEQIQDKHMEFEGKPGQPAGAVTLQSPKTHAWAEDTSILRIDNYAGRIYYGQSQFYIQPKQPRISSSGTEPLRLILAGHLWYDTKPRLELGPNVKLTLLASRAIGGDGGKREIPDVGVDDEAMAAVSAALDDLRQLGEVDLQLEE